jgi:hypothetical protein
MLALKLKKEAIVHISLIKMWVFTIIYLALYLNISIEM